MTVYKKSSFSKVYVKKSCYEKKNRNHKEEQEIS